MRVKNKRVQERKWRGNEDSAVKEGGGGGGGARRRGRGRCDCVRTSCVRSCFRAAVSELRTQVMWMHAWSCKSPRKAIVTLRDGPRGFFLGESAELLQCCKCSPTRVERLEVAVRDVAAGEPDPPQPYFVIMIRK